MQQDATRGAQWGAVFGLFAGIGSALGTVRSPGGSGGSILQPSTGPQVNNAAVLAPAWAPAFAIAISQVGTIALPNAMMMVRHGAGGAPNHQPDEIHHNLPQEFEQFFRDAGLEIEDFTEVLPRDRHRLRPDGLHVGPENWNEQWAQFIHDFEAANADQIIEQLNWMRAQRGLPPWPWRP